MREETVARRYAAALLAQVRENDATLRTVQGDLQRIAQSLHDTPALGALLAQPLVTETRKKHVLAQAFQQDVQPVTLAFLNLLVDKRRANLLLKVQAEFDRMVREVRNIAYATATSAVPLTAEQSLQLERALEARTGKDIELNTEVDPELIGGILVRIGDTVLDGTVRGNLERLREQLLAR